MNKQPQVAVVIRPFHELGLTLCRLLALEGTRIVVLDRDPAVGEAFCQRLGLEGFSASYRYVDPDLKHGEDRLREDLADVYGRIRALITFFEPVTADGRINWLKLSPSVSVKLVQQAFDWRLRMLKAMTPLFAPDAGGLVLNVLMGQRDEQLTDRPDAMVAGMLNQLLAPEWSALGVQVRQVATSVGNFIPGAFDEEFDRLREDVDRVLEMINADRTPAN
jgi:hypothetical protein